MPPPALAPRRLLLALAACAALAACVSGSSGTPTPTPSPASCSDGVQNEGETGVDCGGPCEACGADAGCVEGWECASGVCTGGVCAAPTCSDGVQNGDEGGVDCGGAACAPCAAGGGCASGSDCTTGVCLGGTCDCGDADAVYVSATTGDDANPGTRAAPLRTIQAAVACGKKVPRDVRVAEGSYDSTPSARVTLVEGKSLVGGWSTDFALADRDPAAHVSEIVDRTDPGTTGSSAAVLLSSTSPETVLDGFTIQATVGGGTLVTAVAVIPPRGARAGGTVRGNVIECGGNAEVLLARCIDLGTARSSLVVTGNTIRLGTSKYTSWGVKGDGVSDAEISRNLFTGGSSAENVGVDLWVIESSSPVVSANDFRLGGGSDGDAAIRVQLLSGAATPAVRNNVVVVTGGATGIDDAAGAEISNNTVVAATGTAIRTSAAPLIRNNAIAMDAAGTCIAETSATAVPAAVAKNDLSGCGTIYDDGSRRPPSIDELNALPGASGNFLDDPLLDPANGYRPLAGSPLLGAGLDLSTTFQTDKAGAIRATPWSVGAYQAP